MSPTVATHAPCTVDNCTKVADYTFVWPWGTAGACCQDHVVVVQQKARAARGRNTNVPFTKLDPDRKPELTRNERVELHSARLTAEAERDDSIRRAQKLFETCQTLSKDVQLHQQRATQFASQVKALQRELEAAIAERDAAILTAGEARAELERHGITFDAAERRTPTEVPHPYQPPEDVPHVVEGEAPKS